MIDIQLLRRDAAQVAERLKTRGLAFDRDSFERLETQCKAVQTRAEELQSRRNALSRAIGQAKSRGEPA